MWLDFLEDELEKVDLKEVYLGSKDNLYLKTKEGILFNGKRIPNLLQSEEITCVRIMGSRVVAYISKINSVFSSYKWMSYIVYDNYASSQNNLNSSEDILFEISKDNIDVLKLKIDIELSRLGCNLKSLGV